MVPHAIVDLLYAVIVISLCRAACGSESQADPAIGLHPDRIPLCRPVVAHDSSHDRSKKIELGARGADEALNGKIRLPTNAVIERAAVLDL